MNGQDAERDFLMNPQDAVVIYQLKPGEETRDLRFEGFRSLKRAVERENYEAVYTGELPAMPKVGLVDLLETLYTKFNLNLPEDFTGHSLSVSDVVAIRRDGQVSAHYVDTFGFVRLDDFIRENPMQDMDAVDKLVWKPIGSDRHDWLFSCGAEADKERGCIGYLRGDFGRSGAEFWTSWFDHQSGLKSSAFMEELQGLVNTLREPDGLLHDFTSMRKDCHEGAIGDGIYGFHAESGQFEYCLRCTPRRGDYNFYLYCYDKAAQREHGQERRSVLGQLKAEQKPVPRTEKKNRASRETER